MRIFDRMFRNNILIWAMSVLPILGLYGQDSSDKGGAILVNFGLGLQLPGGDLSERFGFNSAVGGGVEYVFKKDTWGIELTGDFMFGRRVKTDVLDNIRTSDGIVIGRDFFPADIFLRERGWYTFLQMNRYMDFTESPDFFGLRLGLGAGWMQHWIRLQDDNNTADQVRPPYDQGYDRLTEGIALKQFIGVQYLDDRERINFYVGVEFFEGITKSVRAFNFDERRKDNDTRLDLLFGLKFGWTLPLYFEDSGEEVFY